MKREPKLIICLLIFIIGVFFNLFFSTALHLLLSRQMTVLKLLPMGECVNSLFASRQHMMLFLCLQGFALVMAIMFYFTNLRPYQSDLNEITPDIKTPVSVGQFQHGSARWLSDEEKDKVFDSFILDPSHPLIKKLLLPNEKFES